MRTAIAALFVPTGGHQGHRRRKDLFSVRKHIPKVSGRGAAIPSSGGRVWLCASLIFLVALDPPAASSSTLRRLRGEGFFDEALVMSRGAPAADSGIGGNGRVQARVAE